MILERQEQPVFKVAIGLSMQTLMALDELTEEGYFGLGLTYEEVVQEALEEYIDSCQRHMKEHKKGKDDSIKARTKEDLISRDLYRHTPRQVDEEESR